MSTSQNDKPDKVFLHEWLDKATDEQVMLFVAEMAKVSPQSVTCFRLLAMVLVGAKKVDRKYVYGSESNESAVST